MNPKLAFALKNIEHRVNSRDDFVRAEVIVERNGKRDGVSIEWPNVESESLVCKSKQKKEYIAPQNIVEYIAKLIGDATFAIIECVDRRNVVKIEWNKGKVNMKRTPAKKHAIEPQHVRVVEPGTRQQFIKAEQAKQLLTAIGIMSEDGQIKGDKRRKYYQVDRFVELVDQMLDNWPNDRRLHIVDCGCGKSYLSFVLNYYLHEVRGIDCFVTGIDINEDVILRSQDVQQKLGYRNMRFIKDDVRHFRSAQPVNMVLSLHACDVATDWGLALGIRQQANYIVAVPCCQQDLTEKIDYGPLSAITKHPVFKHKLADVLTDGIRTLALEAAGYRVSVAEYVSPLDTPKNIMIRAKKDRENSNAESAYANLKAFLGGIVPAIERI